MFRKDSIPKSCRPRKGVYDLGDMEDLLFPEAARVLQEAVNRHSGVFAYAVEAIDMAHIAYGRERDHSSKLVPGIPSTRRARNDINDDAWRFLRSVGEPLISANYIRAFTSIDGGDIMVLPDGMHLRLKKGGPDGTTSNYPTPAICRKANASTMALFSEATPLDGAIQEGVTFDIVFIAGDALGEYTHIGLRFAAAEASPFLTLDAPTQSQLRRISPAACELVADARNRLAS
jgi:hypothetical protein